MEFTNPSRHNWQTIWSSLVSSRILNTASIGLQATYTYEGKATSNIGLTASLSFTWTKRYTPCFLCLIRRAPFLTRPLLSLTNRSCLLLKLVASTASCLNFNNHKVLQLLLFNFFSSNWLFNNGVMENS